MSRETKFRVWDKTNKIMTYPPKDIDGIHRGTEVPSFIETGIFAISMNGSPIEIESCVNKNYGHCIPSFPSVEVKDDLVLMRYTGMSNRKGVDIYQSDILTYQWDNGDSLTSVVKDGWFYIHYRDESPVSIIGSSISFPYPFEEYDVEVIGNIYENPEMIDENTE